VKVWTTIILLATVVVLTTLPVSMQPNSRGVELTTDQASAYTYRRARVTTRRVVRRTYRRSYYYYH
jgi:hypothetical protein